MQELTVLPSHIVGLLQWVVCHKFSSCSWLEYLSQHLGIKFGNGDLGHLPARLPRFKLEKLSRIRLRHWL